MLPTLLLSKDSYEDGVEIELITIDAGEYYWEAFGHSAIRVKSKDYDLMYGFGYFNFDEDDFFVKFAKGEMDYFLGIQDSEVELNDYVSQNRKIWRQTLQLSLTQKQNLISKLNFLARPENRYYHYDYFLSNCTSRIRDLLDEVTNKEISKQLKGRETSISWNDSTFPVKNQAWMNLGIAMGYGVPAYLDRDKWQLSVFPVDFSQDLKDIKTNLNWNKSYLLFNQPSNEQAKIFIYNFVETHYAVLLIVLIFLLAIGLKVSRKPSIYFYVIMQSLIGVALLMLWFMTRHTITAWNINVLLFFPLNFLLLFKKFRSTLTVNLYLVINIIWLLAASIITNLYLLGFFVINIVIWKYYKADQS
jgi:hypothetical protein